MTKSQIITTVAIVAATIAVLLIFYSIPRISRCAEEYKIASLEEKRSVGKEKKYWRKKKKRLIREMIFGR